MDNIKTKLQEIETRKESILKTINEKNVQISQINSQVNDLNVEFIKLDGAIRELTALVPTETTEVAPVEDKPLEGEVK